MELRQLTLEFDATLKNVTADVDNAIRDVQAAHGQALGQHQAMLAAHAEFDYLMNRWRMLPGEDRTLSLLLDESLDALGRVVSSESRAGGSPNRLRPSLDPVQTGDRPVAAQRSGLSAGGRRATGGPPIAHHVAGSAARRDGQIAISGTNPPLSGKPFSSGIRENSPCPATVMRSACSWRRGACY